MLRKESYALVKQYGLDRVDRRDSFIHYRSSRKVWLAQLYNNLTVISVPVTLYKIIELRKLSTRIVQFINLFSDSISALQDMHFKEQVNQMFLPLRSIVEKTNDENAKNKGLCYLNELQNKLLNLSFIDDKFIK